MPNFKVICHQDDYFARTTGLPKYHDDDALQSVVNYAIAPGKARPGYTAGFGVSIHQPAYEMRRLSQAFDKDFGLRLRHWVLTFSKEELRMLRRKVYDTLYKIAWEAASYYGYQHQIIFAIHGDTKHAHIHFVMNTVNFITGHKYGGDKADYFAYQRYLTTILIHYGLELTSIPDCAQDPVLL